MKRFRLIIAVAVLALTTLACRSIDAGSGRTVRGSGNVGEEARDVGPITGVELATAGTLHIDLGSDEALRIEAEDMRWANGSSPTSKKRTTVCGNWAWPSSRPSPSSARWTASATSARG